MSERASDDPTQNLAPAYFIDSDAPEILALVARHCAGSDSPVAKARALFRAVRDGWRYDPYSVVTDREQYRASAIAEKDRGFCVPKAILLTAVARAAGIPARVGFADVKNHLASPKLRELMQTDLFVFHGYTEMFLEGQWLKATPAFNAALCERFGVAPLEFDGKSDALLHAFDGSGQQYMEYVHDRGTFADFPFEDMLAAFREHYPFWRNIEQVRDDAFHGG